MSEEDPNFVETMPEDYFAYEEMVYPDSKCRKPGQKKRDKFKVPKDEKQGNRTARNH